MQVMTTGANEMMEWFENICHFAIWEISEQYNGCGGCFERLGGGRNDRNLARANKP